MARLKMYEQQTTPGQVRASPVDMGAGVAQAMGQAGEAVLGYGDLLMRREESLAAIKARSELPQILMKDLEEVRSQGDIAREDTVKTYEQRANQRVEELLKTAGGRSGAQNELRGQLMGMVGQSIQNVRGEQIKEQYRQGVQYVDSLVSSRAADATYASSPENMTSILTLLDKDIDRDIGGMFDQNVVAQMRQGAKSKLIQTTVTALLNRNDVAGAEALRAMPEFSASLDPESSMRLNLNIAVARGKLDQDTARQEKNVAKWRNRLGTLTPQQEITVRTMPEKKDMTAADEIAEYELVTGKPASQEVVDKIYKVATDAGTAGGLKGKMLSFLSDNAPAFAIGALDGQQARLYMSYYADVYGGQERLNPLTGAREQFSPTVPNHVRDAMSRGAGVYQGMGVQATQPRGNNTPGSRVRFFDSERGVTVETTVGPDGFIDTARDTTDTQTSQWGGEARGQQVSVGGAPATTESGTRTLWSMADALTGPIDAAKRLIGSGPVDAGMGIGSEQVSAQQFAEMEQRSLVRALQQNPRYAEGERKSIERDIEIGPAAFSNKTAYQLRMIEIGKYIAEEIKFHNAILAKDPASTTKEQKQQAMQSLATLQQFYPKLGLPQQVKSVEEAKKLPPGTSFLDKNWNLWTR